MTQTKQPKQLKYKPGDLVQHREIEEGLLYYGLGIIIAKRQSYFGLAYHVYWTKIGLDYEYEDYLKKIEQNET